MKAVNGRLTLFLALAAAVVAVAAERRTGTITVAAQECSDSSQTPEQMARSRQAVQLARSLNTAEAKASSTMHAYQPLSSLDGIKIPEGFAATLVLDHSGYMFKVQDKAACGVTMFSDQEGVIYSARPLQ